jgi:uncharacterized membrane protein
MVKKKSKHKISRINVFGWRPVYLGLIVSSLFFFNSLFPSLLPRPWWLQGVLSGLSAAIGYGIGVVLSFLIRWFTEYEVPKKVKFWAWRISKFVLPLLLVVYLYLGRQWQNGVRNLLGEETIDGAHTVRILLTSALIFFILIALARFVKSGGAKLNKFLDKKLPPRLGMAIAIIATGYLLYAIISGVLFSGFIAVADKTFGNREDRAPEGIVQPDSSERSGSPQSLIAWDKIGYQGRGFVGGGPSKEDIQNFNKSEAKTPIRIYAGIDSGDTPEARADLVVKELIRTKAFDRKVLVVATPTGTGWLDPKAVDAIEFMYQGDTAIATQQYSYLPSWISFLVDKQRATEAGNAVFNAVVEEWDKLPEGKRPKLLVYGLSLGSFGSQAAFSGANDVARSVDGALWVGTPNESMPWRNITDNRDEGSPEWQPEYKGGRIARFASNKEDLLSVQKDWKGSRVLYQQHASDPVVWFSFDLPLNEPDWLNEKRGPDVSPETKWYPFVSFFQIGLDQAIAGNAPIGHGHYYTDTTVYAWASVLPPNGWTNEKSDKLQNHINDSFKSNSSSL